MDQSKQQDSLLTQRLSIGQVKRRIIETVFAFMGYFIVRKTNVPTIFGTLLGGLVGMTVAQLIFPTKCRPAKCRPTECRSARYHPEKNLQAS